MNIVIIPARAGSKRIPNKNILEFNGAPFLVRTISFFKKSNLIDKIFVSTDSLEIAEIAKNSGALVPFIRPKNISSDKASTIEVIKHFIKNTSEVSPQDIVLCAYPANPFLKKEDIKKSLKLIKKNKNKFVVTVTSFSHPIERALILSDEGLKPYFNSTDLKSNTQNLKEVFHDVGQFYLAQAQSWLEKDDSILNDALPIFIPRFRAIDIDTEEDLAFAKILFHGNSFYENSDKG